MFLENVETKYDSREVLERVGRATVNKLFFFRLSNLVIKCIMRETECQSTKFRDQCMFA